MKTTNNFNWKTHFDHIWNHLASLVIKKLTQLIESNVIINNYCRDCTKLNAQCISLVTPASLGNRYFIIAIVWSLFHFQQTNISTVIAKQMSGCFYRQKVGDAQVTRVNSRDRVKPDKRAQLLSLTGQPMCHVLSARQPSIFTSTDNDKHHNECVSLTSGNKTFYDHLSDHQLISFHSATRRKTIEDLLHVLMYWLLLLLLFTSHTIFFRLEALNVSVLFSSLPPSTQQLWNEFYFFCSRSHETGS